ncbi:DUF262 domain-containing protein [bacterium]|nr:DUF262 domain-containing protein [bacterium]
MSYTPRSLFRLLEDIDGNRLLLPHIQRPFVWQAHQTERLFDSLMRDYPIQTFLFWRTTEAIRARRFMQVVDPDADLSALYDLNRSAAGVEKTFVLDGQQRLQSLHSLFRGAMLNGSGAQEEAYIDPALQSGHLAEGDLLYPVRWSADRLPLPWFRIRDLVERHQNGNALEIADILNEQFSGLLAASGEERRVQERRVRSAISQLSSLLNHDKHFWIDELDGVAKQYPYRHILEIFVRVNSGGTKLTAGDLMFAAMKEGWDDVETRIEQTLDLLNGGRLTIESDFVLKALSLAHGEGAEITTAKFEGTRGASLLSRMEAQWDQAEQAFRELRDFMVHSLRLQANRVVRSYNALIPLFVHLFHRPKPDEFRRVQMTAYFHKAQLFGWFGSQTDATLNVLVGRLLKSTASAFPLDEITQYFRSSRGVRVELADSDLWDTRLRPLLLNIVYSRAWGESPFDVSFKGNEPHVDHIYPQHMLRSRLGFGNREINDIGNLRFVGATDNIRKRAELPASYFARLKRSGVPIEKHLLVLDFATDPARLAFDADTYDRFRGMRRDEIWRLLRTVVDPDAAVATQG